MRQFRYYHEDSSLRTCVVQPWKLHKIPLRRHKLRRTRCRLSCLLIGLLHKFLSCPTVPLAHYFGTFGVASDCLSSRSAALPVRLPTHMCCVCAYTPDILPLPAQYKSRSHQPSGLGSATSNQNTHAKCKSKSYTLELALPTRLCKLRMQPTQLTTYEFLCLQTNNRPCAWAANRRSS